MSTKYKFRDQAKEAQVLIPLANAEGRLVNSGGIFKQEYIIADQQGNARLSFQDNGAGTAVVKQENSYYATGLIMPNSPVATPTTPNNQLYNGGSEWQNDYSNLPDYYQTFNRNYDAAIARFIGVDPVAESAASMTSYQYAGNNPVMFNDPFGDLLSLPGSHSVTYTPWAPSSFQPGVNSDAQNMQNSFFNIDGAYGINPGSTAYDVNTGNLSDYGVQRVDLYNLYQAPAPGKGLNYDFDKEGKLIGTESFGYDYNTFSQDKETGVDIFGDGQGSEWKISNIISTQLSAADGLNFLINSGIGANQGGSGGAALAGGGLLATAWEADALDPEPVTKVVGAVVLVGVSGYYLYKAYTGYGNPKSWSTTYQPSSQNPINNPPQGFDPNNVPQGWGGAVGFGIVAGFGYTIYDNYQSNIDNMPTITLPVRDATYVAPVVLPFKK